MRSIPLELDTRGDIERSLTVSVFSLLQYQHDSAASSQTAPYRPLLSHTDRAGSGPDSRGVA